MFPIHDRGYKRLFSHPRLFRQLLETFVAEDWVKELDFDHCTKMEKSFISKHYKATETDLLYQVKLRGQPAYIYILIEFQSTVTWFMAVRLLHYLSSFWLDYAENHPQNQKLPPVFPLLLYSGDERWNAATDLAQLLEQPALFKSYTPQFRYCAIAENAYTPAQLLQINNLVSTLFLAETHDDLELLQNELLNLFDRETDKEAISLLLNWFKQLVIHGRRDRADYEALEQVYHDKLEAKNMLETAIARERALIFAQGKAEGEAEGIAKGKAEGIAEGKAEGKVEGIAEGKAEGKAEGEAIGSANFLISLLEKRFGSLTPEHKKQLHALETPTLLTLAERLWNAQSLEDILNGIEE